MCAQRANPVTSNNQSNANGGVLVSLSLLRLVLFLNDAAKDGDIAIVVVWSSPLDEGGMQVRARVFPVLQKKKTHKEEKRKLNKSEMMTHTCRLLCQEPSPFTNGQWPSVISHEDE